MVFLKSELLKFLSRMPKADDSGFRSALGTATGVDRFIRQIPPNQTTNAFFDQLLRLLTFEGRTTLVSFLNSLINDDFLGKESQSRLIKLIEQVQALTNEEWEREFWESASTHTPSRVPFVLPQLDISTFTGRKDELKQLEDVLLSQKGEKICSIVGLTGGGGIGKSALAYHFATIHKDKFPDGVIGVRVDNKDINTIAREFASRIGKKIDPEEELEAGEIMQKLFAPRRMLLIFDNAEEASIKVLRPGDNRCAVIVTTRNQNLPFSFDVAEKATIRLRSLPQKDALELLRKILGKSRIDKALSAAQKLTKIVGRLPLALQVVGAALRGKSRPLESYANSLQKQKDQLKLLTRLRVRGDKDFNVEASLNLSLELLEEEEIDFFACLSACAEEGFAMETAMAAGDCADEWEAEEFLERLYELSLLNYAEKEQNRFVLHPLVHEYAKSLAQEKDLLTTAQEHHAAFFLEWLKSGDLEEETEIAEVAANLDDVILAVEWLQTRQAEITLNKKKSYKFALKLQFLFERYGYWQKAITLMAKFQSWAEQFQDWNAVVKYKMHEARYWSFVEEFEKAEEILSSAQINLPNIEESYTRKRGEAKVLNVLAGIYQKQGKVQQAIETFRQQILIDEEIGDDIALAIAYNRLGGLFQQQNKLEQAQQAFERSIEISEALNDQSSLSIGLNRLGGLFQQQNKLEEAQQAFERQIEISEALNDQSSIVIGLNRLGEVFRDQGDLKGAKQQYLQAIEIDEFLGNQKSLAISLDALSRILDQLGEVEQALSSAQRCAALEENHGSSRGLTTALMQVSKLLKKTGQTQKAIETLHKIADIEEKVRNYRGLAITLTFLANLQRENNSFQEAEALLQQSKAILEDHKDLRQLAKVLNILGSILKKQQRWKDAEKILRQSYDIAVKLNNKRGQAIIANNLGQVMTYQEGEESLKYAKMYFRHGIKLGKELEDEKYLAQAYGARGNLFLIQEDFDKAISEFHQGFEINENLRNINGLKKILPGLTNALSKLDRREEALAYCERALEIAPYCVDFLHLRNRTKTVIEKGLQQVSIKTGLVLNTSYNEEDNSPWGEISPDDESPNILFNRKKFGSNLTSKLTPGTSVEVEVEEKRGRLYATHIRIIEEEEELLDSDDEDESTL